MVLQVRQFAAKGSDVVSRAWAAEDPFLTGVLNTYGVLVPRNEAFYISTIRAVEGRVREPSLSARVDRFIRQEAQHGAAHHRMLAVLDAQGYRFRTAAKWVNAVVYGITERALPLRVRMSMVACIEYVNAYVGHEVLSQRMLDGSDPTLRAMYEWHFAEEIEHRAVAYDVFQALSSRWVLRVAGVALTVPLFYLLLTLGSAWFAAQDRSLFTTRWWRGAWGHLFGRHRMVRRSARHLWAYLKPSFHPSQALDDELAEQAVARWSNTLHPIAL